MTAPTPEQAAAHAFVTGCVERGLTASMAAVPPEGQLATVRGLWADVAEAALNAERRRIDELLSEAGIAEPVAAHQPQPAPGDFERAFTLVATERNQLRWALGRLADNGNLEARERLAKITPANEAEPQPAPGLPEQVKRLVVTLRRISDQQEAAGHPEGAYATGCAATMVEALIPPPGCGCTVCEATGSPHGVPQPAPGPAGCECGHAQTGHAFSDDVCAVPECPCSGYRSTPRAAPELAAAMAEARELRAQLAEVLGRFFHGSAGWDARISGTVLAREYKRAALPVPDSLKRGGLPS